MGSSPTIRPADPTHWSRQGVTVSLPSNPTHTPRIILVYYFTPFPLFKRLGVGKAQQVTFLDLRSPRDSLAFLPSLWGQQGSRNIKTDYNVSCTSPQGRENKMGSQAFLCYRKVLQSTWKTMVAACVVPLGGSRSCRAFQVVKYLLISTAAPGGGRMPGTRTTLNVCEVFLGPWEWYLQTTE